MQGDAGRIDSLSTLRDITVVCGPIADLVTLVLRALWPDKNGAG